MSEGARPLSSSNNRPTGRASVARTLRIGVDIGGTFTDVMPPDTEITFHLPGGGGCGDPLQRDPAAVVTDVLDGLVSVEHALESYGVVVDVAHGVVDQAATARARAAMRAARA